MSSLIFFIAFVALIIWGISAMAKSGTTGKRKFGDGYFYFMAFVALMVLYWGVADLFRIILEKWWLGGVSPSTGYNTYGRTASYANEQWLRGLSLRVSAILVSVPIWLFHWHKAVSRPKEEIDEAGRRAYNFAIVLVFGLSSIGMLIGALYLGVNALLGITLNSGEKQSLAYLLPYSLGSLALWWSHWKVWHAARTEEMAAAKAEENKEVKTV